MRIQSDLISMSEEIPKFIRKLAEKGNLEKALEYCESRAEESRAKEIYENTESNTKIGRLRLQLKNTNSGQIRSITVIDNIALLVLTEKFCGIYPIESGKVGDSISTGHFVHIESDTFFGIKEVIDVIDLEELHQKGIMT